MSFIRGKAAIDQRITETYCAVCQKLVAAARSGSVLDMTERLHVCDGLTESRKKPPLPADRRIPWNRQGP